MNPKLLLQSRRNLFCVAVSMPTHLVNVKLNLCLIMKCFGNDVYDRCPLDVFPSLGPNLCAALNSVSTNRTSRQRQSPLQRVPQRSCGAQPWRWQLASERQLSSQLPARQLMRPKLPPHPRRPGCLRRCGHARPSDGRHAGEVVNVNHTLAGDVLPP